MQMHHQYGHISMQILQEMTKQSIIPKQLSMCPIPICSSCLYSKATRWPWQGKMLKTSDDNEKPTKPGQVILIDQLLSPLPGLIAQTTGCSQEQNASSMQWYMLINTVGSDMFTFRRQLLRRKQLRANRHLRPMQYGTVYTLTNIMRIMGFSKLANGSKHVKGKARE